jgi:Ca2+-binding EF-hand superfamily protein
MGIVWYGAGYLDMEEVAHVCRELGKNLSATKLTDAMDAMDKDGSGEVSLKEFERWWRQELGARMCTSRLELCFASVSSTSC